MKALKNNMLLVFVFILVLTSCQKEQLLETNSTPRATSATTSIPQKALNDLGKKANIATKTPNTLNNFFTTAIASPREMPQKAKARTGEVIVIPQMYNCDDVINDSNIIVMDDPNSPRNSYDGSDYYNHGKGCLSSTSGFEGADRRYNFWVSTAGTYKFKLTKLHADLDLLLYSLDANGSLDKCLGLGFNAGNADELIVANLDMGVYAILVDGYFSYAASSFQVSFECDAPLEITCDFFDNLKLAPITPQSANWMKYSSGSGDTYVSNLNTSPGNRVLHVDDDSDLFYSFGYEQDNFIKRMSWMMYVPSGSNASFGFEKYTQAGREVSMRIHLLKNGSINIFTMGTTHKSPKTFRTDQWIQVDVAYRLGGRQGDLFIDGALIAKFDARLQISSNGRGANKLGGINFWTQSGGDNYFIDDLCHFAENPELEVVMDGPDVLDLQPTYYY
ncbi:MAG: hypothetical protein AAGJ18_03895 [Bacteroidota bacterium]